MEKRKQFHIHLELIYDNGIDFGPENSRFFLSFALFTYCAGSMLGSSSMLIRLCGGINACQVRYLLISHFRVWRFVLVQVILVVLCFFSIVVGEAIKSFTHK